MTQGEAWNRVVFNDSLTRFYTYKSDINTPQLVTLNNIVVNKKKEISAAVIKVLNENPKLKGKIEEYGIGKAEFIRVPNSKGDTLNGWMLKPANFDASKNTRYYSVIMEVLAHSRWAIVLVRLVCGTRCWHKKVLSL